MSQEPGMTGEAPGGMSTGMKWFVGCLVAFLVFAVVCGVAGYFFAKRAYDFAMAELEKLTAEFEAMGFGKQVTGKVIDVAEPVSEPTLFTGQVVNIEAGSSADIAIIAQSATIAGTVEGTVHFVGQTIAVKKDAVIRGNLNARAQMVTIDGVVEGEVTGEWQKLDYEKGAVEVEEVSGAAETPEEGEAGEGEGAFQAEAPATPERPAAAETPQE